MSSAAQHLSSRASHEQHSDERTRLRELERHENKVRDRERARVLVHMLPVEQHEDDTGFCEGGVI